MSQTIDTILSTTPDRDERARELYQLLGITAPGAYAIRTGDDRLMVWASQGDSHDDDGARATYRSPQPISDAAWVAVQCLAWVDESEAI